MSASPHRRPSGTEYAEHVRDVLQQADRFEGSTAASPTRRVWAGPGTVLVLFLALLAILAYDRALLRAPAVPPPSPEEARRAQAVTALMATQAIEAFREERGRLPASLAEAGLPEGFLVYEVEGDRYTLRAPAEEGEPGAAVDLLESLRELGVDPGEIR